MNLFLDSPIEQRRAEIAKLKAELGECTAFGAVMPENWLRGQFSMKCQKGVVGVFFTLAPTRPPGVQHFTFRKLESGNARMVAPTGAPPGVSCSAQ